ncbi:hypothetical protein Plhal703r1_c15g0071781 [Plasmopara halstedii]
MATPWENKDRECRLRLKTNFNNDYYGSRDEMVSFERMVTLTYLPAGSRQAYDRIRTALLVIVRGDIGEEYDTPAFLDENTNAVSQKL